MLSKSGRCSANLPEIENRKLNFIETHTILLPRQATKIRAALAKKGEHTTRGEQLKLDVRLLDFKSRDIKVSVGCSSCGKNCATEMGQMFMCDNCNILSTSEGKIYFNFKTTDGSATIELVAYTKNAEKLLKVQGKDFYTMNFEEREAFVEEAKMNLRKDLSHLIITPVSSLLLKQGKVKWILKDVVDE